MLMGGKARFQHVTPLLQGPPRCGLGPIQGAAASRDVTWAPGYSSSPYFCSPLKILLWVPSMAAAAPVGEQQEGLLCANMPHRGSSEGKGFIPIIL